MSQQIEKMANSMSVFCQTNSHSSVFNVTLIDNNTFMSKNIVLSSQSDKLWYFICLCVFCQCLLQTNHPHCMDLNSFGQQGKKYKLMTFSDKPLHGLKKNHRYVPFIALPKLFKPFCYTAQYF